MTLLGYLTCIASLFSSLGSQFCLTFACVVLLGACGDKVEQANTKPWLPDTVAVKLPLEGKVIIP